MPSRVGTRRCADPSIVVRELCNRYHKKTLHQLTASMPSLMQMEAAGCRRLTAAPTDGSPTLPATMHLPEADKGPW